MRKSVRIALAGVAGGTILTVVPIVNPFHSSASTEDTRSVGVAQESPFPTKGTVPVVTPTSKSSESASGAPKASPSKKTHDSSKNAPYGDAESVRREAQSTAKNAAKNTTPKKSAPKKTTKITYISGYSFCGSAVSSAQRCIDAGKLTLYYPAGVKTLAGHNYMGWYWMDDLPVGRVVKIQSGGLAGTYKVYGHGWAQRGSKGGKFPSNGYGASVALQTCTSNGTGFSFLRRI